MEYILYYILSILKCIITYRKMVTIIIKITVACKETTVHLTELSVSKIL